VRGLRDEVALRGERTAERRGHPVEGERERADLPRPARVRSCPQISLTQAVGCVGEPPHRAGERARENPGEEQPRRDHGHADEEEPKPALAYARGDGGSGSRDPHRAGDSLSLDDRKAYEQQLLVEGLAVAAPEVDPARERRAEVRPFARRVSLAQPRLSAAVGEKGAAGDLAAAVSTIVTVIERYSRPAMKAIWSDEGKLARWLEVELAALDGWADAGAVPADAVAEIRERAAPPTPARVAELERRTQHDLAAFVDAVAEAVGPPGRWFHYGLTSSDVLDTALALQVRAAGTLLVDGLEHALTVVVRRAEEHRDTVMVGRTHGVHAEPTTFGAKLAGWAFELDRDRERLGRALTGMRVGKLSGAVGTYGGGDPEVERVACERLGLSPEPVSTQIVPRDRHAELLCTLALCASSLERFATEIRQLARTEVREVEEPFGRGQKGSSAMPHKRNPIVSERICGLARVVRAAAGVGLENVVLWHERDISHSSAERVVIPDAFLALDYMLDRFAWLVDELVVHGERMRDNLEASHGLVFSQRVLLALVAAGLPRDEAYRLVQRNALRSWDEELEFRVLVEADDEIAGAVGASALADAFDLGDALRHVDLLFQRLATLIPERQEAVHA
jgi:adenylosuccinate lyase